MLESIFALLEQKPLPSDEIRATLQAHPQQLYNLPSVCGSFKTLYALNHEVAVGLVKGSNAREMLSKEKELLMKLAEFGLPVIKLYSDVFELDQHYQAVLLQWIPDSILIDVKDFDSAQRKLMIAALGLDFPVTGEAWVLHKDEIEHHIKQMFANNAELHLHVKKFAKTLHVALLDIINILECNALRIADLQLLVTKQGNLSIIDPIDVVKIKSTLSNTKVYLSILDHSEQDNPDFVTQLSMGQDMLNNCLQWCSDIAKLSSNALIQSYFLTPPSPMVIGASDVRKSVLKKAFSVQEHRQSPLVDISNSKGLYTQTHSSPDSLTEFSPIKKEKHSVKNLSMQLLSMQKEEETLSEKEDFEPALSTITFQFQRVKVTSSGFYGKPSFSKKQPQSKDLKYCEDDNTTTPRPTVTKKQLRNDVS